MKHVVSIEVAESTPMSDRLTVALDGVTCGIVDLETVEELESPVMPALILLGFHAVQYVDEAGHVTPYSVDDLLRRQPTGYAGPQPVSRGEIVLALRWSEPLEEYRLDVAHNGVWLKSVSSGMNLRTLREILARLGFTIGQIEEAAHAG
ncbi:hypothetical protein [Burkholderia ambifaria]|uniref:hypothetical protein n=1 Tax=Burkholderia ambifaria TaxID=152480 RepID=UPI000F8093F3|nr:hypothetical protein [Burkholderia ambifaria]